MCWHKRDIWKASIAFIGVLLLVVLMVWVPVSVADAHERASEPTTPTVGTAQASPTVDPTMTALQKEQLTQQVRQLDNWWLYVLYNGSTALIAAFATLAVAFFGLYQWLGNQNAERKKEKDVQDKELRDRAEERFKTAVATLGDENEATQVGGAILLRSFLNKDDKGYKRYYAQIFDLAVAYLRLPRAAHPPEDPDGPSLLPERSDTPQPLTILSQALVILFKEAFPLARSQTLARSQDEGAIDIQILLEAHLSQGQSLDAIDIQRLRKAVQPLEAIDTQQLVKAYLRRVSSLDASSIQLDNAYLSGADLRTAWMPQASLRKADLSGADLSGANLSGANLSKAEARFSEAKLSKALLPGANLDGAKLSHADLSGAALSGAFLFEALLSRANLSGAHLNGADLRRAGLSGADLSGAFLEKAKLIGAILESADLRRAHLSGADLHRADLSGADLSGADLSEAILGWADFSGANLSKANLSKANLSTPLLAFLAESPWLGFTKADFPFIRETQLIGTNLEDALSLKDTDLRGAEGLTKEQLEACKAGGAIIDEATMGLAKTALFHFERFPVFESSTCPS